MHTIEEMACVVVGWYRKGTAADQQRFLETQREDLTKYHSSLGRKIRNEFNLWENNWTPEVRDGVDCSEGHPDQISMKVIEQAWDKLQSAH